MSAADGYGVDIGYTAGFYPQTAPLHMAFAAMAAGRDLVSALRPKHVLELGFGQGFGLALLAAANPDVGFEGCDFNPVHVQHAQGLIDEADLANLSVSGLSFAEAALQGNNDVDIIIANGVLAWIGPADRDAIVTILRRRLRPGGACYVSYNCMPGSAPLMPIRRLMLEVKRRTPGSTEDQVRFAMDLVVKLWQAKAGYFIMNPMASHHVQTMLGMEVSYLAHEYLAEAADLPTFCDVAILLAPAGLSYVASADVLYNLDQYAVPDGMRSLLPQIGDPVLRELARDFGANRRFRRDIFARHTDAMAASQARRSLSDLSFALAVPPERIVSRFLGPVSELALKPEFHAGVIDRLVQGIASFDELRGLPPFAGSAGLALDCLALLVDSGQVLPILAAAMPDPEPARRFNRMVARRARAGCGYGHLASPVARTGVAIDAGGLQALATCCDAEVAEGPRDASALPMQPSASQQVAVWRHLGILR